MLSEKVELIGAVNIALVIIEIIARRLYES